MHAEATAGCAAGCAHRSAGVDTEEDLRPGRGCRGPSRAWLVAAVLAGAAQAVCVRAYAPPALTQRNPWASGGALAGFPSTPPLRARGRLRHGPGMVAGNQGRKTDERFSWRGSQPRTARKLQLRGVDTKGGGAETEEARGERFQDFRSRTTRTELNAFVDRQDEPETPTGER
jgi:hypothetical protein